MSIVRTTKIVGFSMPPQMAKEEHWTKSEMFREMVRFYRTYRKHVDQAEEEQFQRMVDEAGNVNLIVSRDLDLLRLKRYEGIGFMSPIDFLHTLGV